MVSFGTPDDTIPAKPSEAALNNEYEQAIQEILYYNHLKRMFTLDERRLTALMDDMTSSVPDSLLSMKIGDIIDYARGIKTEPPVGEDCLGLVCEMIGWVCRVIAEPEETSESVSENVEESSWPEVKRVRRKTSSECPAI